MIDIMSKIRQDYQRFFLCCSSDRPRVITKKRLSHLLTIYLYTRNRQFRVNTVQTAFSWNHGMAHPSFLWMFFLLLMDLK